MGEIPLDRHQRICHLCGETRFTAYEQYNNEVVLDCDNCGATVKFYCEKDFYIEES